MDPHWPIHGGFENLRNAEASACTEPIVEVLSTCQSINMDKIYMGYPRTIWMGVYSWKKKHSFQQAMFDYRVISSVLIGKS
jgi:hypothetical protein